MDHRFRRVADGSGARPAVQGLLPVHLSPQAFGEQVPGIGKVRAGRIAQAWADHKEVREIKVFLHSLGIDTARAVRIFKTYGNDAAQVMAENPYGKPRPPKWGSAI